MTTKRLILCGLLLAGALPAIGGLVIHRRSVTLVDAAIVDSADIVHGGAYTAAAGTNRALVIVIGSRGDYSGGVTFGGVSFVEVVRAESTGDPPDARTAWIGYILEADIPGGSQTVAGAESASSGRIYTLEGIDQSTPVADSAIAEQGAAGSTTLTATSSLSVTAGAPTVGFACWRNDRTSTLAYSPDFGAFDRLTYPIDTAHTVAAVSRIEASTTSYTPNFNHGGAASSENAGAGWVTFNEN